MDRWESVQYLISRVLAEHATSSWVQANVAPINGTSTSAYRGTQPPLTTLT